MNESWLQQHWHVICAFVFLFICLADLVVLPFYCAFHHLMIDPVLFHGAGVFFMCFGGLMGVGCWANKCGNEQPPDQ